MNIQTQQLLEQLLAQGNCSIGEVLINDDFSLRHQKDSDLASDILDIYHHPEEARKIARYDQDGCYRPLKTAPNLMRGWLLQLKNLQEVVLALDFLYPVALSLWLSYRQGTLEPTPLRETLNRQSGMYRIAQQLSNDQACELMTNFCSSQQRCLRKIQWQVSMEELSSCLPPKSKHENLEEESKNSSEIPLICREACNLFVAAARSVVKTQP